jgi:predicted metal-dependent HD superfamily phosphohydrolase
MSDEDKVSQRIMEFMVGYSQWNLKVFDQWQAEGVAFLDRSISDEQARFGNDCLDQHFVSREAAAEALGSSFGSEAEHDPNFESIESVSVEADTATVVTRKSPGHMGGSYEYALHNIGGNWLIAGIEQFFSDQGQRPSIANLVLDAALLPLFIEKLPVGLEKLFDGEAVILTPYGERRVMVQEAGFMTNQSGFLACADSSNWSDEISFFDLLIPPGRYPVQLVLANHALVAARVIFDTTSPVSSYALATQVMPPDTGRDDWTREMSHLKAVRSCAALGDAAFLASCSSEELERMARVDSQFTKDNGCKTRIKEMGDQSSVVYFTAGNGGCMPFWALSASGGPVMLYIDFVEYGQKAEDGDEEVHYYDFFESCPSDDHHWRSLASRLGLSWPEHITAEKLREQYRQRERCYHTLQHLNECLAALDAARSLASVPNADAIEMALWFHDLVYLPRADNNEEESARIAELCLVQAAASPLLINDVKRLILATKRHQHDSQEDAKWLIDIDLAIFGQPKERFAEYERQIRKEYEWVTEDVYREKRVEILEAFLLRPRLYQTDYFYQRLESQARANLRELVCSLKF